jgi:hypothetical protein
MIKFTSEQLSKILTAHANGGLVRFGKIDLSAYPGCLIQVAHECESGFTPRFDLIIPEIDWVVESGIHWFDKNYNEKWTTVHFLHQLEWKGLA